MPKKSRPTFQKREKEKAINNVEDLLKLRVALEAEPEPPGGNAIDGSEFAKFRANLPGVVQQSPASTILRRRPN